MRWRGGVQAGGACCWRVVEKLGTGNGKSVESCKSALSRGGKDDNEEGRKELRSSSEKTAKA